MCFHDGCAARLARAAGHSVRCVLTDGGAKFVTPMTLAALSEDQVFPTLWDLKDEVEMGPGDMIVVPPDVEHWAETVGDEPVVDLSVFSPKREEYAAEEARR